jgi:hypothetical protein
MRNGLLPAQGIQRPRAIAASKDWPCSIGECEDLPRTIAQDEIVGLGETNEIQQSEQLALANGTRNNNQLSW